jgi:hypothetical protein
LNRKAKAEGKDIVRPKVSVSLSDDRSGGQRAVQVVREIRHRPSSPPVWNSFAKRSETPGLIEDAGLIQKIRDVFLPRHLARFFFFDAERSQSINLGQKDIVEGVSRILGLWTYHELENDLRHVIHLKIPRIFDSPGGSDPSARLTELAASVIATEEQIATLTAEQDALERTAQECAAKVLQADDELRTIGAVDPEELRLAQERRSELTKLKYDLRARLAAAWEVAIPVALLGKYRVELHDYLLAEDRRR